MEFLAVFTYLVTAAAVVFLSIKLSDFVDLLDKKTNLSGALLGGILLAAVTSLPELFTSITSTIFLHENSYVLGNILGSDIFNVTLFAIIYLIFFKKMVGAKVGKFHLLSFLFIGLCYAITTVASFVFDFNNILWGWFNPMSILIVIVYAISIWKTPKVEEGEGEEEGKESKLTLKQIVILFIVFAVLLVGASIGITYVTDWVSRLFNLSASFGGALFLGVATSLPEMTATINLCRKKNFNAAYGNILGSCVFNFIIMALADAMSFSKGMTSTMYHMDQSSFLCLVCGAFTMVVALLSVLFQLFVGVKNKVSHRIYFYITATLLIGSYLTFVILSGMDLGIPFAPFTAA